MVVVVGASVVVGADVVVDDSCPAASLPPSTASSSPEELPPHPVDATARTRRNAIRLMTPTLGKRLGWDGVPEKPVPTTRHAAKEVLSS